MTVACLYFNSAAPLQKIAEALLRLSPQICFSNSALFIEIGKCHRLYSSQGFLLRVQVILKRFNCSAKIALGKDISDALVKAKYSVQTTQELPLSALTDYADPFGTDLILQKNVQKMISAFTHLGIKNLSQFMQIPLSELVNRFGAISVLCMQKLRHEVIEPWPFWKPEDVIFEKSEFPYFEFYGELEPILFKLKEQLDRIFQRLWARNLRLQRLHVRVFCETNSQNQTPYRHFEFEFTTPQSTVKSTLTIIKERLTKDFEKNPIKTAVEALETKVLLTVPGVVGQKNLLHNFEEQLEQFHALISQLAEAHGAEHVFQAELTEDRRPEKSWKKKKTVGLPSLQYVAVEDKTPLRPTHLVRPEKIEVTAGYVHIRKRKFRILSWSNFAERISGDWLEQNSYDRSYYQIELEKAPTISVYTTVEKHFYLHGYFG